MRGLCRQPGACAVAEIAALLRLHRSLHLTDRPTDRPLAGCPPLPTFTPTAHPHPHHCPPLQVILPEGYLAGVYRVMRGAGALCVADEVQCGFGRVGRAFWAFELQGVVPDIVTFGELLLGLRLGGWGCGGSP